MRGSMCSSSLLVVFLTVFAAGLAGADNEIDPRIGEPIKLGEEESIFVILDSSETGSREHAVHYPEASFIKVHFSEIELTDGVRVTVENKDRTVIYTYPGSPSTTDESPGFWALTVFGDTAVVSFTCLLRSRRSRGW